MTTKNYDYKAFIDVYIQTRRRDFVHEDFSNYYQGLLEALENLFGMKISKGEASHSTVIWMLFRSTTDSYLSIRTPWSSFLESGLLVTKLEDVPQLWSDVKQLSDEIEEISHQNKQCHLELIYTLFHHLYGETDKVFTSLDLLKHGFDDSKEPNKFDYD